MGKTVKVGRELYEIPSDSTLAEVKAAVRWAHPYATTHRGVWLSYLSRPEVCARLVLDYRNSKTETRTYA